MLRPHQLQRRRQRTERFAPRGVQPPLALAPLPQHARVVQASQVLRHRPEGDSKLPCQLAGGTLLRPGQPQDFAADGVRDDQGNVIHGYILV